MYDKVMEAIDKMVSEGAVIKEDRSVTFDMYSISSPLDERSLTIISSEYGGMWRKLYRVGVGVNYIPLIREQSRAIFFRLKGLFRVKEGASASSQLDSYLKGD